MKTILIYVVIGAALGLGAVYFGKHLADEALKLNVQKEVQTSKDVDAKIDSQPDSDLCTKHLGGKLSDLGECE